MASKNLLIVFAIAFWPPTLTSRLYTPCQKRANIEFELELNRYDSSELCICEPGYRSHNGYCIPICEPACDENFECIDFNVCKCKKGYRLEAGKCLPVCEPACVDDAYCHKPNECRCKSGYEFANLFNLLDYCKAVCEPACGLNQYCLRPNFCVCKPNFVLLQNGNCEPICSRGCPKDEHCVGVEYCDCKPGLVRNKTDGKCYIREESAVKDMGELRRATNFALKAKASYVLMLASAFLGKYFSA